MISSYQPFTFSTLKDSYRLLLMMQLPLLKAPFTNFYSTLSAGVAEISLFNGIQWENAIYRCVMPSSHAL